MSLSAKKDNDILKLGNKNIPDGRQKIYNSNYQIAIIAEFKNGKIVSGKEFVYKKDGLLNYIRIYKNSRYIKDEFLEDDYLRYYPNVIKESIYSWIHNHYEIFRRTIYIFLDLLNN